MSNETKILEQFYAAINSNDMQAVIENFATDVERIEPPGFPASGTYRGIPEVQEHIAKGRATWAEGACTPEKYFINGDKVVAYVHVLVRLQDASDWIEAEFADGFVVRDGKIVQHLTFAERADALAWADIQ